MKYFIISILVFFSFQLFAQKQEAPVKLAIIGLSHSHVHWVFNRKEIGDIELIAIVETNKELVERFKNHYSLPDSLFFGTFKSMVKKEMPEAVAAFGSIYEHLAVVENAAPLGIHIMVEKPLAVNMKHANKMAELAKKHGVHLLTNYETTWYATNHKAYAMVKENKIGELRKIVVHDGHQGPKEIGVNKEFLSWLTDPILNGGGAITDFGCYGANLITWLMYGQKPLEITAITQTNKPAIYPKVDDEATILLKYPKAQGIIQASWNWPYARKDMEIYGETGAIFVDNKHDLRYKENEKTPFKNLKLEKEIPFYYEPFALLAGVIRNKIKLPEFDLPSLENNLIVVEILEKAKISAKQGKSLKITN